ncbi:MAG: hypothetical protein J0L73_14025 [Verrucomicrobia bacterium]|nr:hypothetical protein [Verrucomicrobiota bacterium]
MKLADPDSLPPTSPRTMAVLILILIGLMAATFKAALYPSPPAAWQPLQDPHAHSLADTNTVLSKSGAVIESIKPSGDITTETWNMRHRTGNWTVLVRFAKTPQGDAVRSIQIRSEISHLPAFTRTWDYPPVTNTPASKDAPAAKASSAATDAPAASTPAPPSPAANAPAK